MIANEVLTTHYDREWGRRNNIVPKDVKDSLKMIYEVARETSYSLDTVKDTFLKLYNAKNTKKS